MKSYNTFLLNKLVGYIGCRLSRCISWIFHTSFQNLTSCLVLFCLHQGW